MLFSQSSSMKGSFLCVFCWVRSCQITQCLKYSLSSSRHVFSMFFKYTAFAHIFTHENAHAQVWCQIVKRKPLPLLSESQFSISPFCFLSIWCQRNLTDICYVKTWSLFAQILNCYRNYFHKESETVLPP